MQKTDKLTRRQRAATHRLLTSGPSVRVLETLASASALPDAFRHEALRCASRLRALEAIISDAPAEEQRRAMDEMAALHPRQPDQTFADYDATWTRIAGGATRDDLCRVLDDPRLSTDLRDTVARAIIGLPLDGAE